jgi:hypothetical protein
MDGSEGIWFVLQAIGAPIGAYLVQHLEPQPLNFAIATSLMVLFLLMVCPVTKCMRRLRRSRSNRLAAPDLRQPLIQPQEDGLKEQGTPQGICHSRHKEGWLILAWEATPASLS